MRSHSAELFDATEVEVAGDGLDSRFQRLGSLASGRRAEVEEALSFLQVQEGDYGLGADILDTVLVRRQAGRPVPPHSKAAGKFGGFAGGKTAGATGDADEGF